MTDQFTGATEWLTLDTWIISDTHWGHDNIVRYCHRPQNHDELMFSRWRETVGKDDPLLHLGDVMFWRSSRQELLDKIVALPGRKRLIVGNHDKRKIRKQLGFVEIYSSIWLVIGEHRVFFTHAPAAPQEPPVDWTINIHGHIHNNGYDSLVDRTLDYRNVSVEVMDYRPVRLREILEGGRYQSVADAPRSDWS